MQSKLFKWLNVDGLLENGKNYIDARVELIKLEVQLIFAKLIASLIVILLIFFSAMLMICFLSLALAQVLNQTLESAFLGYAIMGFFYLCMIVVFWFARDVIRKKFEIVSDDFFKAIQKKSDETEDSKQNSAKDI